jgi:amino acid adenylation domain-containing protein
VLVVTEEAAGSLAELLPLLSQTLTIISDSTAVLTLAERFDRHTFMTPTTSTLEVTQPQSGDEALAYVIYTSGSTGEPKGVAIRRRSVRDYAKYLGTRYGVSPEDRVAQFSDLTFDFSVHDLWLAWSWGACLSVVPRDEMLAPASFIHDAGITCWASVPSVAGMLSRLRLLRPNSWPALRMTVFCGEPLPEVLAAQWQAAAPNAVVENIYGPTEATVAISHFRWDSATSPSRCINGVVPIGWVFDGQRCAIASDGVAVERGEPGELLLNGSQVAVGYWRDAERSAAQFVEAPSLGPGTWYRTGDVVREDADGCMHFVGRVDHQIKVQGFRVELQEVEHAVRIATGCDDVSCVGWPVVNGRAEALYAFVGASASDAAAEREVIASCRSRLPA